MNKKRTFVMFLLAAIVIAELFGPPARGVSAGSTYTYVHIMWVTSPSERVCVGDKVSVMFIYVVQTSATSPSGLTPVPGGNSGQVSGTLTASAQKGTLTPATWGLRKATGAASPITTYTATSEGWDKITISGSGFSVDTAGASTPSFEVVKCSWNVEIAAHSYITDPTVIEYTEWLGKGTIAIENSGVLEGQGTYSYTLGITYIPDPSITCDVFKSTTAEGTFVVSGTEAMNGNISATITFYPAQLRALSFHCRDSAGIESDLPLFPGGQIDPNASINFGTMVFSNYVYMAEFPFKYADGWGRIWFTKRGAR